MLNRILEKAGLEILTRGGSGDPFITDICYDSRKVSEGSLYIAIPGTKVHGDSFINEALSRGALAVISQNPQTKLSVPWIQVKIQGLLQENLVQRYGMLILIKPVS